MKKIGVVTGTRAEYGLLKPVMNRIKQDNELKLCILVTGTHLEKRFGETYQEILDDGFQIDDRIAMRLSSDSPHGISQSMSYGLAGFSEVFEKESLDMLVVLGDRYEMVIVVIAAMLHQIPVAHIHGGEITEGIMDDAIRHSITKMSDIHFTSTQIYRRRVIQMGEQPERVFCVGALGVENIKKCSLLEKNEFLNKYGIPKDYPIILVTYHPVTLEQQSVESQFQNLLRIIRERKDYYYLFTYANADIDGQSINRMIDMYTKSNDNCQAVISMGQTGYLSALKYCTAVMGNSSSGIIEAPSFGIPTVNIGERQKGRIRADSVIDCGYEEEEIRSAFQMALDKEFQKKCRKTKNPYEGTNTSEQILEEMKKYLSSYHNKKKIFYDIMF